LAVKWVAGMLDTVSLYVDIREEVGAVRRPHAAAPCPGSGRWFDRQRMYRTCQNSGGVCTTHLPTHNVVKHQNEREAGRDTVQTPKNDRCARPVDTPMRLGLYC